MSELVEIVFTDEMFFYDLSLEDLYSYNISAKSDRANRVKKCRNRIYNRLLNHLIHRDGDDIKPNHIFQVLNIQNQYQRQLWSKKT